MFTLEEVAITAQIFMEIGQIQGEIKAEEDKEADYDYYMSQQPF